MANDLTWVFRFTIEALVRIGGIIVYMFFRSWQLALLACSAVPVTAIVNRIYAKCVRCSASWSAPVFAVALWMRDMIFAKFANYQLDFALLHL